MLVYTISKGTNKSYVYDIYRGARGEKGDQGPQGEQGIQGLPGTAATIQVGNVSSGAAPSVTNVGTSSAAIFDFVLEKGDKGDQGPVGQAAGFGTPTASASSLPQGSEPTVSISASGDSTQKVFAFSFGIPKGDKGDKGDQGIQGETGPAAGFGTPTASATLLPSGSNPTASVTASGADTSKVFAFEFGIPSGDTNVQSDWNQTDTTADDYIKNKPTIPTVESPYTINWWFYKTANMLEIKIYKDGVEYTEPVYIKGIGSDGINTTTNGGLTVSQISGYYKPPLSSIKGDKAFCNVQIFKDSTCSYLMGQFTIIPQGSIASNNGNYVTGDQVYTALQSAGGDVWEFANICWNDSQSKIQFQVYKNGALYTESLETVCRFNITLWQISGYSLKGDTTSINFSTSTDTYYVNFSSMINIPGNKAYPWRMGTVSLTEVSSGKVFCISSFYRDMPATSISSTENGFATGKQVYNYVSTEIGNINTILQSI